MVISSSFIIEQKEKLTEVEQQLKKAEAAQRRRMQVEKANREQEVSSVFCVLQFLFINVLRFKEVITSMF